MSRSDSSLTTQLGKTIRLKRKELGLTQEELAERIGVGHQALSRIENGVMAPKMDRLPLIAETLKCTVPDLFFEDSNNLSDYPAKFSSLLSGLPKDKLDFVYQHIAGLVFLLKLDR